MKTRNLYGIVAFRIVLVGALFLLTSCVTNTKQEQSLKQIQSQISVLSNEVRDSFKKSEENRIELYKKLNGEVRVLQKNQANASISGDQLNTSLTAIDAKLDEYNTRMKKLSERLDRTETALSERITLLSEQVNEIQNENTIQPAPSDTRQPPTLPENEPQDVSSPQEDEPIDPEVSKFYHKHYTEYVNGNFDSAISGFTEFLELYPESDLSDIAQFWVAESYFSVGDYETALQEYDKLISKYPDSDKIPAAFFSKADAYLKLDRQIEAISHLKYVVNRYPNSVAAQRASERLRALGE